MESLSRPSIFKIMSENLNTKKRNLKRHALTGEQKKKSMSKKVDIQYFPIVPL